MQQENIDNKQQNNGKKRILIVEDDKFLRELIVGKLEGEGYEVLVAVDGLEGVKSIQEQKPSLVLLDLMLPNMDGFEVLQKIKDDPTISSMPVIILSNLGQREDVERGLSLGAVDFMIKAHFTPNEVIEKVKGYL